MTAKSASKGGLLPNLRIGATKSTPRRNLEREEREEIAERHRNLKADFKRRDKLRKDRGRKR